VGVYANFDPHEGSLSGENVVIIEFNWKARKIIIINDSSTRKLHYKFNESETYGTLNPTETISLYHHSKTVYLHSPSSAVIGYRVWAYG
jgi:hypothetical protein